MQAVSPCQGTTGVLLAAGQGLQAAQALPEDLSAGHGPWETRCRGTLGTGARFWVAQT